MTLAPGFADPVREAQTTFRRVLEAFSNPGRVIEAGRGVPPPPAPLAPASFALALTLLDFEIKVWLDPALSNKAITDTLRFHCGCPLVETTEAAAFAFLGEPAAMPGLDTFAIGTPEYPERGATIVLQVPTLTEGTGTRLSGPGIRHHCDLRIEGLPRDFWESWQRNHGLFPQGVDVVLVAGDCLAALPRSIGIEV